MNIIDELEWRGAVNQQSDEKGLRELIDSGKEISVYCGTDPTGDSLHIGHLIPFMMLERFRRAGHHPYILIGGGTGTIGDPSGRTTERTLQTLETVQNNVDHLTSQLKRLFGGGDNISFINNYDWLSEISLLEFLRDYGKDFGINKMLAKDIVSSRMETGISFTEFSYQILQSIDFLYLFKEKDIQLEIGGADQWGNITAGLDLIRKKEGADAKAFGLTIPLMLKADGTKFGKSAGGAIWLDRHKTSPFEFYQFWLNQDDRDVIKYLKFFTFLTQDEIKDLEEKVKNEPEKREAQRRLAEEVTKFVHSEEDLEEAQKISKALFSGEIKDLNVEEIEQGFKQMPTFEIAKDPENIVELLVATGIESSKRQAREDVTNGAISINGEKVRDVAAIVDPSEAFDGKYVVVRRGRKKYFLLKVK
ncbi:tyrosine--tRNA ligase [Ligilactobacillus ceti]|uniref:Tyrosine--tRNA ligase n=1 Tax=Ligilactobacillus ceti DSM 22408 TaxID=1122146 RepID=A0A0R2KQG2_9LACO|nr:tyrosine--tRNA ligase [Ligilactobacillus ceti]KRN89132.1 Tyrosyl-tRNA synthetase [Ligilactobacillus ceti DSM 22408]